MSDPNPNQEDNPPHNESHNLPSIRTMHLLPPRDSRNPSLNLGQGTLQSQQNPPPAFPYQYPSGAHPHSSAQLPLPVQSQIQVHQQNSAWLPPPVPFQIQIQQHNSAQLPPPVQSQGPKFPPPPCLVSHLNHQRFPSDEALNITAIARDGTLATACQISIQFASPDLKKVHWRKVAEQFNSALFIVSMAWSLDSVYLAVLRRDGTILVYRRIMTGLAADGPPETFAYCMTRLEPGNLLAVPNAQLFDYPLALCFSRFRKFEQGKSQCLLVASADGSIAVFQWLYDINSPWTTVKHIPLCPAFVLRQLYHVGERIRFKRAVFSKIDISNPDLDRVAFISKSPNYWSEFFRLNLAEYPNGLFVTKMFMVPDPVVCVAFNPKNIETAISLPKHYPPFPPDHPSEPSTHTIRIIDDNGRFRDFERQHISAISHLEWDSNGFSLAVAEYGATSCVAIYTTKKKSDIGFETHARKRPWVVATGTEVCTQDGERTSLGLIRAGQFLTGGWLVTTGEKMGLWALGPKGM